MKLKTVKLMVMFLAVFSVCLIINSDNASAVDYSYTFGTEYTFSTGNSNSNAVDYLNDTYFVQAYTRAVSVNYYGSVKIGVIAQDGSISYGSEYTFNGANTKDISVIAISNTKFVVAYTDVANSGRGTAILGTVSSGTTVAFGSEIVFNTGSTEYTNIDKISSTQVVVTYADVGNSRRVTGVVGTVSGSTLSFGSEYLTSTNSYRTNDVAVFDTNKFVVFYGGLSTSQKSYMKIGTVSTNTITFGTEYEISANYLTNIITSLAVTDLSTTQVVAVYTTMPVSSSYYIKAKVVDISSETLTPSSEYSVTSVKTTATAESFDIATLDSTNFAVAYTDVANTYGNITKGTISGSVLSFESDVTFNTGNVDIVNLVALSGKEYLLSYQESSTVNSNIRYIATPMAWNTEQTDEQNITISNSAWHDTQEDNQNLVIYPSWNQEQNDEQNIVIYSNSWNTEQTDYNSIIIFDNSWNNEQSDSQNLVIYPDWYEEQSDSNNITISDSEWNTEQNDSKPLIINEGFWNEEQSDTQNIVIYEQWWTEQNDSQNVVIYSDSWNTEQTDEQNLVIYPEWYTEQVDEQNITIIDSTWNQEQTDAQNITIYDDEWHNTQEDTGNIIDYPEWRNEQEDSQNIVIYSDSWNVEQTDGQNITIYDDSWNVEQTDEQDFINYPDWYEEQSDSQNIIIPDSEWNTEQNDSKPWSIVDSEWHDTQSDSGNIVDYPEWKQEQTDEQNLVIYDSEWNTEQNDTQNLTISDSEWNTEQEDTQNLVIYPEWYTEQVDEQNITIYDDTWNEEQSDTGNLIDYEQWWIEQNDTQNIVINDSVWNTEQSDNNEIINYAEWYATQEDENSIIINDSGWNIEQDDHGNLIIYAEWYISQEDSQNLTIDDSVWNNEQNDTKALIIYFDWYIAQEDGQDLSIHAYWYITQEDNGTVVDYAEWYVSQGDNHTLIIEDFAWRITQTDNGEEVSQIDWPLAWENASPPREFIERSYFEYDFNTNHDMDVVIYTIDTNCTECEFNTTTGVFKGYVDLGTYYVIITAEYVNIYNETNTINYGYEISVVPSEYHFEPEDKESEVLGLSPFIWLGIMLIIVGVWTMYSHREYMPLIILGMCWVCGGIASLGFGLA